MAQEECVTKLTQEQVDYMNDTRDERDIIDMSIFDSGITSIPLVAHVVRDSNGNGGLSEDALKRSIDQLNERYVQVGFEFSLCKTNFIDNTNHFNGFEFSFSESSEEYQMAKPNLVTGAVNIFFAPNPLANGRSACGWSSFPAYLSAFGKDWTVMKNDCATNGSTLAHEMGHFFNLYHTHQGRSPSIQVFEDELVDGSNCGKNVGDELCDTPAEPSRNSKGNSGISGCVNNACVYTCNDRDKNNELYKPNPKNLMSYAPKLCRDFFSPQQIARIQQSYAVDRSDLLNDCTNDNQNATCEETDRTALIALYNTTDGQNWSRPWDLNADHKTWGGISVNSDDCVDEISLSNNNLTGEIPPEIGNLTELIWFRAQKNNLTGEIPAEIKNLTLIERIDLSSNNITGIPAEIKELTTLDYLDLGSNKLEGAFPLQITELKSLRSLDLTRNNFSGIIPTEIGALSKLHTLRLSSNQFTGAIPEEIGNLTNLTHLYLGYNRLTGNIPKSFNNLIKLNTLSLRRNSLSGCFEPELNSLCSQLLVGDHNKKINESNNFDALWNDFCNIGAGTCANSNNDISNGDFNNDGIVNHADAIYLGLSYGNTGPTCAEEENRSECPDWNTEVNGVNAKFQDGDGNGIIDEADLKAIEDNYGVTSSVGNLVSAVSNDFMFKVEMVKENASELVFDLFVDSFSGESISTHGLACSINFGSLAVKEVKVDFENSALEPKIVIERFNVATNTLDISMSRTDKVNKHCDTPVASINIAIIGDIDTDELNISKVKSISANGVLSEGDDSRFDLKDGSTKLNADNNATSYISQNKPNPFSGQTIVSYFIPESAEVASLNLYNLTGHLLQTTAIEYIGTGILDISSKDLQAGLYIYTLEIDGLAKASKRMIVH